MDMYTYIAGADPSACQALCNKYGYQAQAATDDEMGNCLEALISEQGEPALRDLVALHPDKELILEMYTASASGTGTTSTGGCGCAKCKGAGPVSEQYIHAASHQAGMSFLSQNHAGMFIIGGLIIVTLAIISQKN